MPGARPVTERADGRLRIDVLLDQSLSASLAADVRRGLLAPQKTLPPKYFYDDRGAELFDAICTLPEYYLTVTEQALLQGVADDIIALAQPSAVVEFGSGASRKTRILLDAAQRAGSDLCYLPVDVSERMLRRAAWALLQEYPQLRIHAVVGDYEQALDHIPSRRHRLIVFLGSTIGNFTPAATRHFLAAVRRRLAPGEHFLLGVDLVKPIALLEAAYNDRAGVTAEFNRNVLHVINRELDADFQPERFEHVAFFNSAQSQIEMYLRAPRAHVVTIRQLELAVPFTNGESIQTEISRKFTRTEIEALVAATGYELRRWYTPANNAFALVLARAT